MRGELGLRKDGALLLTPISLVFSAIRKRGIKSQGSGHFLSGHAVHGWAGGRAWSRLKGKKTQRGPVRVKGSKKKNTSPTARTKIVHDR